MSRSARFFELIQVLRAASGPMRALDIALQLEVSPRTIYRDIAALQARQVPIEGATGIGYVLRKGYDLPPLNLDVDEAEAMAVGLQMIARTGDPGLWHAASRAARKLSQVAPSAAHLVASAWGAKPPLHADPERIRDAIRAETKLALCYRDEADQDTRRVVWPLVLIYYAKTSMIVAWCELRNDIRSFRLDRITGCEVLPDHFAGNGDRLRRLWEVSQKAQTVTTHPFDHPK